MENLFYRNSTRILTGRGMVPIEDVKEDDFVYYINEDNILKVTSHFDIVTCSSSERNIISGKRLFVDYIGNFKAYKDRNLIENYFNKPFNLKISENIPDDIKEFNKIDTNVVINFNSKEYKMTNLNKLILSYILESFFIVKDNKFVQNKTLDSKLLYKILLNFYHFSDVFVQMNRDNTEYYNESKELLEIYNRDCSKITKYFLKNIEYLQDFLDTLIHLDIIETKAEGKYEMYFGHYKLAADFQALISLLGYKTLIKYNKYLKLFVINFYLLTGSLTTKPTEFNTYSLLEEEKFYNIYIYNEPISELVTQCTDRKQETCIYYGVSAIKDEDTSYNNLGDDD